MAALNVRFSLRSIQFEVREIQKRMTGIEAVRALRCKRHWKFFLQGR